MMNPTVMTLKETILLQPMARADKGNAAWDTGDSYFMAAREGKYRALSKDQMEQLLRSAMELQKESGLLYIYEDDTMPRDARVAIIYQVCYAMTAISIYAIQKWPEMFDSTLMTFFRALLEGTFCRGIVGHGYETPYTVRHTLMMLIEAGVKEFLVGYTGEVPVFADVICNYMLTMEHKAQEIDEQGTVFTADGLSDRSVNHEIKRIVACWNEKPHPVFVYGTLMRGERANEMLADSVYAGTFLLQNYAMYDLGAFPGIRPCEWESVYGELYYTDSETLEKLDYYEGNGSLYDRVPVVLKAGYNTVSAEAYVYRGSTNGCRLIREPWVTKDEDLVWYAGYGSNLSSERFACYISGGTCTENGRTYYGATDKTPARASKTASYPGTLYFGNSSPSWNGGGVAFYQPEKESEEARHVPMHLYMITRGQLRDVMLQEGMSPNWYGRLLTLGMDDRGVPIYTLTSETTRPTNEPSPEYVDLMSNALRKEFKWGVRNTRAYLSRCMENSDFPPAGKKKI